MSKLHEGDTVRIRPFGREKTWTKAQVEDQVDSRSYEVRTEDGRVYRRNRRHLRRSREPFLAEDRHRSSIFFPDFNRDRIKTNTPNSRDTDRMETAVNNTPETHSSSVVDKIQKTPEVCIEPTLTSDVPSKRQSRSGREIRTPKKYQDFVCDIECYV